MYRRLLLPWITHLVVEIGISDISHVPIGNVGRHLWDALEGIAKCDSPLGRANRAKHGVIAGDGDRFPARQGVEHLVRAAGEIGGGYSSHEDLRSE
ncbi:hypothetical protein CIW54_07195 [Paraburkholderia sp. T12-10]|nr:hypothetical protein CIW54_07195 [Paraburkholderia sp. T12-10]